jgi:hypothetical protein
MFETLAFATGGTMVSLALMVMVALALSLNLDKNYVPQPLDTQLLVEAAITKTAAYNGASFDQGAGFAPGGVGMAMAALINVTACDRSSGDETYAFKLQESADNISFVDCGPSVSVDVAGAVATLGMINVPGFVSLRYQRVVHTPAGTTPSITYETYLSPNISPTAD